ncbi:MAG: hypothetical protein ABJL67_04445 [Sulfitobacter sp.]
MAQIIRPSEECKIQKKRDDPNIILPNDIIFVPKYPKIELLRIQKVLHDFLHMHASGLPTVDTIRTDMITIEKTAEAAKKKRDFSIKAWKAALKAEKSARRTAAAYKQHAATCRVGGKRDGKMVEVMTCLKEEQAYINKANEHWKIEWDLKKLEKAAKEDHKKALKEVDKYIFQTRKGKKEIDNLLKAHAATDTAARTALDNIDAMLAEHP